MRLLRLNLKFMLLSVVLALSVVSIASVVIPPSDDFQPLNPYWNGLEEFFRITNAVVINSSLKGVIPEKSVLFVIGPSMNYSKSRIEELKTFVSSGGTLVLMDEVGFINSLLSSMGLDIYVDGHTMLDPVFYFRSWRVPKVVVVGGSSLAVGVDEILLNLPSALRVSGVGVRVLARSSSFSFLDLNNDLEYQVGEPVGPFVVGVEASYGSGRVIVFSDSSLFINGIIWLGDNYRLLKNIISDKTVFIDTSIWSSTPQLTYRYFILGVYGILSTPELKYGLVVLAMVVTYVLTRRSRSARAIDEIEELLMKHPEWDKRLLIALKEAREGVR